MSSLKPLGVVLTLSVVVLSAQGKPSLSAKAARGKYITENVGMCQDCHTPRTQQGELDAGKWLKGSTLDFAPINPVPNWHKTTPDLTPAGRLWSRWGEKGLVEFLKTAKNPKGEAADPPMPAYKLSVEDAEAVVEYLKTLK